MRKIFSVVAEGFFLIVCTLVVLHLLLVPGGESGTGESEQIAGFSGYPAEPGIRNVAEDPVPAGPPPKIDPVPAASRSEPASGAAEPGRILPEPPGAGGAGDGFACERYEFGGDSVRVCRPT